MTDYKYGDPDSIIQNSYQVDSIIVDWYLVWKKSIFNEDGSSNLSVAVFMLKQWIKYWEFRRIDLNADIKEQLYSVLDLWEISSGPSSHLFKDGNLTHNFGVKKEILRQKVSEIFTNLASSVKVEEGLSE